MTTVLRFEGDTFHRSQALLGLTLLLQSLDPQAQLEVLEATRVRTNVAEHLLREPLKANSVWTLESELPAPVPVPLQDERAVESALLFAGTLTGALLGFAVLLAPTVREIRERLYGPSGLAIAGGLAGLVVVEMLLLRNPGWVRTLGSRLSRGPLRH